MARSSYSKAQHSPSQHQLTHGQKLGQRLCLPILGEVAIKHSKFRDFHRGPLLHLGWRQKIERRLFLCGYLRSCLFRTQRSPLAEEYADSHPASTTECVARHQQRLTCAVSRQQRVNVGDQLFHGRSQHASSHGAQESGQSQHHLTTCDAGVQNGGHRVVDFLATGKECLQALASPIAPDFGDNSTECRGDDEA